MKDIPSSKENTFNSKIREKSLILLNDNQNTFNHVIDCLISLCDHDPIQAEQCAMLTHYKGSCEVLLGESIDLELVKKDLILYGLNVEVR